MILHLMGMKYKTMTFVSVLSMSDAPNEASRVPRKQETNNSTVEKQNNNK